MHFRLIWCEKHVYKIYVHIQDILIGLYFDAWRDSCMCAAAAGGDGGGGRDDPSRAHQQLWTPNKIVLLPMANKSGTRSSEWTCCCSFLTFLLLFFILLIHLFLFIIFNCFCFVFLVFHSFLAPSSGWRERSKYTGVFPPCHDHIYSNCKLHVLICCCIASFYHDRKSVLVHLLSISIPSL